MTDELRISFKNSSGEEYHSQRHDDFPYIRIGADINRYTNAIVPWHWHNDVELFYMEEGAVDYYVPSRKVVVPEGCGGMINSGILHMTTPHEGSLYSYELTQIFDPVMLSGCQRVQDKFIDPLAKNAGIQIIFLTPEVPEQAGILKKIRTLFRISLNDPFFEFRVQIALADIWMSMVPVAVQENESPAAPENKNEKLKAMMIYIYDHFTEKMTVKDIAGAAFISERECYREFSDNLKVTPSGFLRAYRLQQAMKLLEETNLSVTEIGLSTGFGSGSYFTQAFREAMSISPSEYRKSDLHHWQDF